MYLIQTYLPTVSKKKLNKSEVTPVTCGEGLKINVLSATAIENYRQKTSNDLYLFEKTKSACASRLVLLK